jgi:hypothetical protein
MSPMGGGERFDLTGLDGRLLGEAQRAANLIEGVAQVLQLAVGGSSILL